MQYAAVALAFFAAVAAADDIADLVTQLPACALPCFQAATGEIGCKDGDFACQCEKVDEFTKAVLPCVTKQCQPEDLGSTFFLLSSFIALLREVVFGGPLANLDCTTTAIQITATKICKEVQGGSDASASPSSGGSSPTSAAAGAGKTAEPSTAGAGRVEAGLLAGVAVAMAFL